MDRNGALRTMILMLKGFEEKRYNQANDSICLVQPKSFGMSPIKSYNLTGYAVSDLAKCNIAEIRGCRFVLKGRDLELPTYITDYDLSYEQALQETVDKIHTLPKRQQKEVFSQFAENMCNSEYMIENEMVSNDYSKSNEVNVAYGLLSNPEMSTSAVVESLAMEILENSETLSNNGPIDSDTFMA